MSDTTLFILFCWSFLFLLLLLLFGASQWHILTILYHPTSEEEERLDPHNETTQEMAAL